MTLIALPFDPLGQTEQTAKTILDGMVALNNLFPIPGTPEERRMLIAASLSDPRNRVWTAWRGGDLCGVLMLTGIVPRIDALCHLVFFDRQLLGRRQLIWNVMGKAFQDLDLQRLTIEIPEHLTPLIRFAQKRLAFRSEGEQVAAAHPLIGAHIAPYVANAAQWAARLGSRRERSFWRADTNEWVDCLRLRLLRSEYEEANA